MTIGALKDVITKGTARIAGAAAGVADTVGTKASDTLGKGADVFEGAIRKIDVKATNILQDHTELSSDMVNRMGAAAGGGVYGATLGAAGGTVIGGVAGGIDDDESFIGGALKGAAIGAGVGGLGGASQGFIRNESNIISTATKDLAYAKKSLKGLHKDGIGL